VSLENAIWLADVVRSLAALQPRDPDSTLEILRALGLHLGAGGDDDRPPQVAARDRAEPGGEYGEIGLKGEAGGPARPEEEPGGPAAPEEEAGEPAAPEEEAGGPARPEEEPGGPAAPEEEAGELPTDGPLETLEPIAMEAGGGMESWRRAEPLERVTDRNLQGVREHEPLLAPGRAGPILAATVETWDLNGPVDVDHLVETVSLARPVLRLPRQGLASLVRGVQLLVDTGLGMEPYARDQQEVVSEVRRVVGRSGVTELRFRNCPTRGAGTGPSWTWRSYRPPAPGTPVLALTDLGIGGPRIFVERSQPWEWRALAHLLARRGSPLVAFVPYPAGRFPSGLARSMMIVPWDRTTTISTVRFLSVIRPGRGS
jgi:hypothetical protein